MCGQVNALPTCTWLDLEGTRVLLVETRLVRGGRNRWLVLGYKYYIPLSQILKVLHRRLRGRQRLMTFEIKIWLGGDLGRPAIHISIPTSPSRSDVSFSYGTEEGSCHCGAGRG